VDIYDWMDYLRERKRELQRQTKELAASSASLDAYEEAREPLLRRIVKIEQAERVTVFNPKGKDYSADKEALDMSLQK
jgi:hypothetical protein